MVETLAVDLSDIKWWQLEKQGIMSFYQFSDLIAQNSSDERFIS